MMAKKSYAKPELLTLSQFVLDDPREEASLEDLAAAERLRPLYLLSQRTDLAPIAMRFAIHGDRRRGDWQRVFPVKEALQEYEQQGADEEWYFLCYVPHSSHFKIELQTLCSDAKTRIAVANEVSIPFDRKLGFIILSAERHMASFAGSQGQH